jgi:site-specific recombinase XerD
MWSNYSKSVIIGLECYQKLGYSMSACNSFRRTAEELKKYLVDNKLPYSAEIAKYWIKNERDGVILNINDTNSYLEVLDDILLNGYTTILSDRNTHNCYNKIHNGYKTAIDTYLSSFSFKKFQIEHIRLHCSRFLRYLEQKDINTLRAMSIDDIEGFFYDNTRNMVNLCRNDISNFLMYLIDQGHIKSSERMNVSVQMLKESKISILSSKENNKLVKLYTHDEIIFDRYEFINASILFLNNLSTHGASKSLQDVSKRIIRMFELFMLANTLPYSISIATYWLNIQNKLLRRKKYLSFRHLLLSINDILNENCVKRAYAPNNEINEQKWWLSELINYLSYKEKFMLSHSAIQMIKCACTKFLTYLDNKMISSWDSITPQVIKEYHNSSSHSTPEGKNAYASRIRNFLSYLSEKKLVSPMLQSALPSLCAPTVKTVKILSDDQIQAIFEYRKRSTSPLDLRDSAIVMLGLSIGLRISDIQNLCFENISWENATISIHQKKTGKNIVLPLPIDTGNSLWKYITIGRPKQSTSNIVFITMNYPYLGLSKKSIENSLARMLNDSKIVNFHILRKTFASKLLASGNKPEEIANALGHSDTSTLSPYLSTDSERMRMCSLSLEGLEYLKIYQTPETTGIVDE